MAEQEPEPWPADLDRDFLGLDQSHLLKTLFRPRERRLARDTDILAPATDLVQQLLVFRRDKQSPHARV